MAQRLREATRPPDFLSSHGVLANKGSDCAALSACVTKLNGNILFLGVRKVDDTLKRLNLAVLPKPNILRGYAALLLNSSRFDEREPWASLYDAAEVREVPIGRVVIVCGVLAKGCQKHAIGECPPRTVNGVESLGCSLPFSFVAMKVPEGGS